MKYRYFIRLSYKGTNFHGWQIQANATSVQGVLEETMGKLMTEKIELTGAGRTDTGVHARDYFAHFESSNPVLHHSELVFKLNSCLPFDIAVKAILPVKQEAHARFSATSRSYKYFICRRKNPFLKDFSYYLYGKLDIEKMNDAAEVLLSVKDFSSFSKTNTQVKTNICKVTNAKWHVQEEDNLIVFEITADRFLRNMVRAIVGTHILIGTGKITKEEYIQIIDSGNRSLAGYSVPAEGLFLTQIEYNPEIFL